MKTRDQFRQEFFDTLLGMAVRTCPSNDEAARGLFIRERQARVGEMIEKMYAYLAGEQKPAIEPKPAVSNGTTQGKR